MRAFANHILRVLMLTLACAWMACAHGAQPPRTVVALDDGWEFIKGDGADASVPAQGTWTKVALPHTFNALDATTARRCRRTCG